MEEQIQPIDTVVQVLPFEIQEQVQDFIEFLLERRVRKPKVNLRLDWRGALRDLNQYTAVELEHKALEWWGADVSP